MEIEFRSRYNLTNVAVKSYVTQELLEYMGDSDFMWRYGDFSIGDIKSTLNTNDLFPIVVNINPKVSYITLSRSGHLTVMYEKEYNEAIDFIKIVGNVVDILFEKGVFV